MQEKVGASVSHEDAHQNRCYDFTQSDSVQDPAWDDFLAGVAGGHHVQTALWARVKAVSGWDAVRIIATSGGQIVGGGQMLLRQVPLVGAVGYVPKGPVVSVGDEQLRAQLIDALVALARSRGVRHFTIQPPNNGHSFSALLGERGFRTSPVPVAPPASLVLDLSPDLDEIMAQLNAKTRYNVRLARRKGLSVREGREEDLATYHAMLAATGERQGFEVYPETYFRAMWTHLRPHGYLRFFIVEHEGEVVSGQLLVPFGDTVINKLSVWSGRHGSKRPNHLLQWNAIEWSQANGYRYYDFEGLDRRAVEAVQNDQALPDAVKQSVASFKLGFGGEPVVFPDAQCLVSSALVRYGYEVVYPKVSGWPLVKRTLGRFRVQRGAAARG